MQRTRGTCGRHRIARISVITTEATVAAIVCCLFGLLQQYQAAGQALASSSSNSNQIHQLKPNYVFPTNQQQQRPSQTTSGQQLPQQQQRQHAIYINPNPSTRSAGFHQQMQQKHRLVAANAPQGNNQMKRAAVASSAPGGGGSGGQIQTNSMMPNEAAAAAAAASAVGHQVLSQVAEWPFYKSLQTARKTNAARYQQHNGLSGDSFSSQKLARQQQLQLQFSSTTPAPQHPSVVMFGDELARRPVVESTTMPSTTTTAMAAQTTTTTQTTTTMTNASPTTVASTSELNFHDQTDSDQVSSTTMAKRNERDSELSSSTLATATTTTTMAPNPILDSSQAASATVQPTIQSSTTMAPRSSVISQDPLFAPNFHTSIQQAINRIVKMTTESAESGGSNKRSTPAAMAAVTAKPNSDCGGSSGTNSVRSSLSLNVLLKNFGVHNLTNLDQILLKSTLRNDTAHRGHQHGNEISSSGNLPNDQKIEIIGLRNLQQPKAISSEKSENGGDQMAECKIEYTMKHVNISLMNGGKGDYTCDYIIDRKMTANSGSSSPIRATKLDIRKVCKLQLTSKFFSDRVEESGTTDSEPANCNGTYLAVGLLRFCYLPPEKLASGGAEQRALDRVFDFPIERDMFDIKMVHKKPTTKREGQAQQAGDDSSEEASEIHLEIRPLADKDCASAQMRPLPATGGDDKKSSTSSLLEPEEPLSTMQMAGPNPKKQTAPTSSMMTNGYGRPANDQVGVEHESPSSSSSNSTTSTTSGPITGEDGDPISENPKTAAAADDESSEDSPSTSFASREPRNRDDRGGQNTNNREQPADAVNVVGQNSDLQLVSRDAHRAKPTAPPKRKIVFKVPQDKQLHPLNNRFKVSQSFDVSSAPRHYHPGGAGDSSTTAGGHIESSKSVDDGGENKNLIVSDGKLCDGFEHVSTVGQLMSPDYPRYYPANVNCFFTVRQASSNFCQLLLHFRDFDLINPEQPQHQATQGQQQHCPNDYLQIGETRYCNKYAMIGHKMRLDFPPNYIGGGSISLSFRSDHMQSGRGFLIKYQQVPCAFDTDLRVGGAGSDRAALASSRDSKQREPITSTTLIGDQMMGGPQMVEHGHTIAPPLQQPDFSLALKTTPSSSGNQATLKNEPNKSNAGNESKANKPAASGNNQQPKQQEIRRIKENGAHSSGPLNHVKFNEKIMGSTTAASSTRNRQESIVNNSTSTPTTAQQLMTMASTVSSPSLALFNQQQQRQRQDESFRSTSSAQQCNQVNNEQSFLLTSFNYPDNYANNLQCLYYVRRNTSQVCYLELTFIRFDLEADADCRYDYLEINNIRLCGSLKDLPHKTTRIYFFNEPIKLIKFKSDDSGSRQGFLIRVDQLECGSSGSILRQGKTLADEHFDNGQKLFVSSEQQPEQQRPAQSAEFAGSININNNSDQDLSSSPENSNASPPSASSPATGAGGQLISQRSNSMRTFEYDSTSTLAGGGRQLGSNPTAVETLAPPSSSSSDDKTQSGASSFVCGGFFEGNEVTIKSPMWPESYANDESLGTCRYTIIRNQAVKNKICQLELRFVSLRLDVSDCIDIDGYEVLCGFNTRNMVKYYPFDRQSQLTITFFAGVGKFARSLGGQQETRLQKSDLLPSRAPFRFMIKAKQHECIDGFLAPQITESSGQDPLQSTGGPGGYNKTNLLYSGQGELRYANRTTADSVPNFSSQQAASSSSGGKKLSLPMATTNAKNDSMLRYDFSNLAPPAEAGNKRPSSSEPTLMYSLAGHLNLQTNSLSSSLPPTSLSPVGLFGGCLDGAITKTTDQLFSANYPLKYKPNLHCALTVSRESEAICHMELEFLDMDLDSRTRFCESDYFQINYAERYCNMEQVETRLGPKRLLLVPFELSNNTKLSLLFHSDQVESRRGFLIRYRQVPCSSKVQPVQTITTSSSLDGNRHHNRASNPESKLIDRIPLLGQPRQPSAADSSSSVANLEPSRTTSVDQLRCSIQFSHYNGILSSSSILSKLKANFPFRNECEVRLKLMPGFCQIQLTFGEFELAPRLSNDYCLELLELNGVQYCGDELKNASRLLSISDLSQRTVQVRYVSSNSSYFNGFRAVFKQIECQPEPLKPVLTDPDKSGARRQPDGGGQWPLGRQALRQQPTQRPQVQQPNSDSGNQQQVEFKEISIRNEFFELNSFEHSKSKSGYDPNMFIVFRLKKISRDVCKLRLMFYKFDLEASLGCKRDFLDVNNVDRLCGQLGKPEETRRDYDWSNDREFLISFVSDANIEREGFLLFGQQLHSENCSNSRQRADQIHQPTFDEAPEQQKTTSVTTTMTPEAPQSQSQPPPPPAAPVRLKMSQAGRQHGQHVGDSSKGGETQEHKSDWSPSKHQNTSAGSDNCYKLFYESKFDLSSPNWPQKYSPKTTCYYLIHRSHQDSANCSSSVSFNVVSMILGPEEMPGEGELIGPEFCDTSTKDYLDIDGRILCGLINRPLVINVDFAERRFITVKFSSNAASGFGFFIEAKQHSKCPSQSSEPAPDQPATLHPDGADDEDHQPTRVGPKRTQAPSTAEEGRKQQPQGETASSSCRQLLTSEVNFIESENFPQHYPHNQDCLYAFRRTNQSICAIDVIMSHFDLEEQSAASGTCESDYLEIDYSRFCGSYPPKHRLRFNYFGDELDKYIKFHSDASVSRSGFSLTVRQATNCATPQSAAAALYQQPSSQPKAASSQPDSDEVIKYLPNTTTVTSLASPVGNNKPPPPPPVTTPKPLLTLAGVGGNHSDAAGDGDELSVAAMKEFSTLCQFVYHREHQYLVSPNYNEQRRSYDNNIDCLYKIAAKGYEFCSLKLTILDLDLEISSECQNDYLLIDNQRYCSPPQSHNNINKTARQPSESSGVQVLEIPFAEALPREIHLLYHTNAHINEGRGFKLFYEQQPCRFDDTTAGEAQTGNKAPESMRSISPASSGPEEREARRMKLGQLSYPQNYVTSQSSASGAARVQMGQSKRAQQQHHQKQPPPASSSSRELSPQKHQQQPNQRAQAEDLDQQHDDLTLRKEIVVVAKSVPLIMVR